MIFTQKEENTTIGNLRKFVPEKFKKIPMYFKQGRTLFKQ